MTSVLSTLVATIALAADPSPKGLPLGLPPAADDAIIAHVAPPHCLLYVNWAGTAAPNASSGSETEKLLAEPEVQELLGSVNRMIVAALRSADKEKKEAAAVGGQTLPSPYYLNDDVQYFPPSSVPKTSISKLANRQTSNPEVCPPPASDRPAILPQPLPVAAPAKPAFSISAEDYGDWIDVLLTHPTAVFIDDVKVTSPHEAEKKSDAKKDGMKKPGDKNAVGAKPAVAKTPQAIVEAGRAFPFLPANLHGGMIVSLGSDSARLHAKFIKYLRKAKKAGLDKDFELVQIAGQTWYRSKPYKLDFASDKLVVTFGFHGRYFVVGIGDGAVEGILARWNRSAPAWLAAALEETPVPRRTGIIYLNLKAAREKLLSLAGSKKDAVATLELLGLNNVDSLVSTTGLEDDGMIQRTLLALDGKPCGLLDAVGDRPLTAADLAPIPSNALLAFAARFDLDQPVSGLLADIDRAVEAQKSQLHSDLTGRKDMKQAGKDAPETAQAQYGVDVPLALAVTGVGSAREILKTQYGIDLHRLLSSLGDTWCVYNSPTEGEIAFLGWTAVVPIRDRAALVDSWEGICAASNKANASSKKDAKKEIEINFAGPLEFRKCRYAGREIYYVAGQAIAPAFCVCDREMVMTLNMPAMKAYLTRKDHRSLAALPGVALALNDRNRPACLLYCDTPRMFDFCYPLVSFYASMGAAAANQANIDLDPTFWPSAPSIRRHLRPDIATVERTPHGLQLTCRYCLPSGGATGPLCLYGMQMLSAWNSSCPVAGPSAVPTSSGNPYGPCCAPQEGTCEAVAATAECCPPTQYCMPAAQSSCACQPSSAPAQPTAQTPSAPTMTGCPIAGCYPTGTVCPATPYIAVPVPCPVPTAVAAPGYGSGCAAPAAPYSACTTTSPYYPSYCPYGGAAASYGVAPAAAPYAYGSFNSGLSPVTGGVAKNPAFGAAVTVSDVIAMTRAKVANELIISQIRNHGLAAPLRPADVITLSQSGVGTEVIAALQTAVAKEECSDPSPYSAASSVMKSSYETSPPPAAPPAPTPAKPVERSPSPRAGSIPAASFGDPTRRAQEEIYTSENLRLMQDQWERFQSLEEPGNVTKGAATPPAVLSSK